MSLPTPSLDDRRFQDIVDEAKQRIPRYCPEWTDHNVSDPGVAIIELFAWMTDLTLYRLNQVPDRLYVKFLELMGITLLPPAPARAPIAFWLSGPQSDAVRIPAGTQVGTIRTEQEPSVVFMTDEERTIVPPRLVGCVTSTAAGTFENHWDDLRLDGFEVVCFPSVQVGDAVYFGFEQGLAGNIVRFELESPIEGRGVNPEHPPWAWEAWGGDDWLPIRITGDGTNGLNTNGHIVMVLPDRHQPLMVGPSRTYWVRCRMTEPEPGYPSYQESPRIASARVAGLGGVASAHHGEPVGREHLGRSAGSPGQVFEVQRRPVLPRRDGETVVVIGQRGEERWTEVGDFAQSGPDHRHFVWDGAAGEIRFGPRVRQASGAYRQYGAVPDLDAEILVTGYRCGGGRAGNVGARTLTVAKSTIPFIGRVENLAAATQGVDAETVEEAKARGPMWLRSGQRAVTVADFERLTQEASPNVARARCLPPGGPDQPVTVLIVPRLDIGPEDLVLDALALPVPLVGAVSAYLDARRLLNTTIQIRPPAYQGITVVARLVGTPGTPPEQVRDRALGALYRYVNPIVGGPEGAGWPFGRDLSLGEVFALLTGIEGVSGVEEVRLFLADLADPRGGDRRDGGQTVRLRPDSLFASFQHQVLIR